MASEQNLRQEDAPPEAQIANQDNNTESTAPSAPPEQDMAKETSQTQGETPPYPYQQQPLQEEKSSDYPPHPDFENKESHNEQQKVQREERWGTPAQMGAPAKPDAHPANKEAASGNLTDANAPNVDSTPDASPQGQQQKGKFSFADVQEFSKKMEILIGHLWGHLTSGSSIKDTAIGRVNTGTRILTHGGFQGLFSALFPSDDDKLKKTYACFLSTKTGPVAGTLFISNKRLAFCSDRPLQYTPSTVAPQGTTAGQGGTADPEGQTNAHEDAAPNAEGQTDAQENAAAPEGQGGAPIPEGQSDGAPEGQGGAPNPEGQSDGTARQGGGDGGAAGDPKDEQQKSEEVRYSYYKLIIPIEKIKEVVPSVNQSKPAEKYIELVTVDDYQFWFMGFVNYDKGVKNLQEAVGNTPHVE